MRSIYLLICVLWAVNNLAMQGDDDNKFAAPQMSKEDQECVRAWLKNNAVTLDNILTNAEDMAYKGAQFPVMISFLFGTYAGMGFRDQGLMTPCSMACGFVASICAAPVGFLSALVMIPVSVTYDGVCLLTSMLNHNKVKKIVASHILQWVYAVKHHKIECEENIVLHDMDEAEFAFFQKKLMEQNKILENTSISNNDIEQHLKAALHHFFVKYRNEVYDSCCKVMKK